MSRGIYSRTPQASGPLSDATRHSLGARHTTLGGSKFVDKCCTVVPIFACVFVVIVSALEYKIFDLSTTETRLDSRVFWPIMAAISVVLAVQHRSRLRRTLPPHISFLLIYLAFAGASILWAFNPQVSLIRFSQQAMVVTSIVLPIMLAGPTADIIRGLFLWCFVPAAVLNVFFLFENSPSVVAALKGYPGLFLGKNYLGEFSGIAFLLSLYEIYYSGRRRVLGIVAVAMVGLLLFLSNSKTAFGLALFCPLLAGATLLVRKLTRFSPAIILLSIPFGYALLSSVSNFGIERISYMLYGDSSLTGRTVIWDFANFEIARKPLLGWGYQSFWLAGPGAPSIIDAPGWVKTMPDAHNGYVDTKLELGYIGLALLVSFIVTTLHALRRMAIRDPVRAWLVLSLALYIIIYNFLESIWMRGFEFMWVVFLVIVGEIARYWQLPPLRRTGSRSLRPISLGSATRMPRPGVRH
jgi:exopolysaccharide production protein ExoQ